MRTMALFLTLLPGIAMACTPLTDHTLRPLASEDSVNLCETYKDQVLLVVNTASKCGYTPQFDGLEALHAQFNKQGFSVLGFPSDNFGNQEFLRRGHESLEFCRLTYGVKFPDVCPHQRGRAKRRSDFQSIGERRRPLPELELPQVFDWTRWAVNRRLSKLRDTTGLNPAIQDALAN